MKRIAVVVFHIHVSTPHKHIAKLFIKNVPDEVSNTELQELLTESGYTYSEFGIAWANHYIQRGLKDAESEVKGSYRNGDAETIEFSELSIDWEKEEREH